MCCMWFWDFQNQIQITVLNFIWNGNSSSIWNVSCVSLPNLNFCFKRCLFAASCLSHDCVKLHFGNVGSWPYHYTVWWTLVQQRPYSPAQSVSYLWAVCKIPAWQKELGFLHHTRHHHLSDHCQHWHNLLCFEKETQLFWFLWASHLCSRRWWKRILQNFWKTVLCSPVWLGTSSYSHEEADTLASAYIRYCSEGFQEGRYSYCRHLHCSPVWDNVQEDQGRGNRS